MFDLFSHDCRHRKWRGERDTRNIFRLESANDVYSIPVQFTINWYLTLLSQMNAFCALSLFPREWLSSAIISLVSFCCLRAWKQRSSGLRVCRLWTAGQHGRLALSNLPRSKRSVLQTTASILLSGRHDLVLACRGWPDRMLLLSSTQPSTEFPISRLPPSTRLKLQCSPREVPVSSKQRVLVFKQR